MCASVPSTHGAEADRSLSQRPTLYTQLVPGQPGLHRQTPSQTKQSKLSNLKNSTTHKRLWLFLVKPTYVWMGVSCWVWVSEFLSSLLFKPACFLDCTNFLAHLSNDTWDLICQGEVIHTYRFPPIPPFTHPSLTPQLSVLFYIFND